ncbi:MAG TPA: septal ring lytic transglycosylase RlpA family protein [Candidatus Cybelea sp.]|nr:septal ring lytic transglycosylase RlpA family protein [Candidatus Cybelea sp.]
MRAKAFLVLECIVLGLGLLVFTPSANPTVSGSTSISYPSARQIGGGPSMEGANRTEPKPLAVWECVTSWYGEDFDGRPTATGEIYNMYGATAAHLTLPLGSIVRVVNPRNNHSQIVRINDRGPYIEGRELDVSYEVARRLGFDQRGTAKLRLELLEVPSRPNNPVHGE